MGDEIERRGEEYCAIERVRNMRSFNKIIFLVYILSYSRF